MIVAGKGSVRIDRLACSGLGQRLAEGLEARTTREVDKDVADAQCQRDWQFDEAHRNEGAQPDVEGEVLDWGCFEFRVVDSYQDAVSAVFGNELSAYVHADIISGTRIARHSLAALARPVPLADTGESGARVGGCVSALAPDGWQRDVLCQVPQHCLDEIERELRKDQREELFHWSPSAGVGPPPRVTRYSSHVTAWWNARDTGMNAR